MASLKAKKPTRSQQFEQPPVKKEPAKAGGDGSGKASASKPAPKKTEQKSREPKKKAEVGKPGAKN